MNLPSGAVRESLQRQQMLLAGEIHDSLLPHLFATHMRLESLADRLNQSSNDVLAPSYLTAIRDEISGAASHLRDAMTIARDIINERSLDEVFTLSWTDQLRKMVETIAQRGEVSIRIDGDHDEWEPDPQSRLAMRRIAQEAISNAIRHGHATHIDVAISRSDDGTITLTVRNDGHGFDPGSVPRGHGLRLMKARALDIQASLQIESSNSGLTTIRVVQPAHADAVAD